MLCKTCTYHKYATIIVADDWPKNRYALQNMHQPQICHNNCGTSATLQQLGRSFDLFIVVLVCFCTDTMASVDMLEDLSAPLVWFSLSKSIREHDEESKEKRRQERRSRPLSLAEIGHGGVRRVLFPGFGND